MTCPDCNRSFNEGDGVCPRCGARKGIVKTSTIFISAGEVESVYRSVEEVPDPLKRQLIRSTNGLNSATIVIADRRGRKEIAKAIRNLPANAANRPPAPSEPLRTGMRPALRHTIGALLLLVAAGVVWLIFHRLG
jgi:hypothetical protein